MQTCREAWEVSEPDRKGGPLQMEGARTGFLIWLRKQNSSPPAWHTKPHKKLQWEAVEATLLSQQLCWNLVLLTLRTNWAESAKL